MLGHAGERLPIGLRHRRWIETSAMVHSGDRRRVEERCAYRRAPESGERPRCTDEETELA